jgi:hypothetical protein
MNFIQHCFICRPSDSTASEDAGYQTQDCCLYLSIIAEERASAGPEQSSCPDDKVPAEDRQRQGAGAHEDGQPGLRQAQGGHAGPQPHPGPGEGDQGIYRDQKAACPLSIVWKIVFSFSRVCKFYFSTL